MSEFSVGRMGGSQYVILSKHKVTRVRSVGEFSLGQLDGQFSVRLPSVTENLGGIRKSMVSVSTFSKVFRWCHYQLSSKFSVEGKGIGNSYPPQLKTRSDPQGSVHQNVKE